MIGLRYAAAKRKIWHRQCTVGAVRRRRSKLVGIVIDQHPRRGILKPSGYPVSLVIGRR